MALPRAKRHVTGDDLRCARKLRPEMTYPERKLWKALRENSPLMQCTFRRQQPIHPYIVDFVCMDRKLVIEVDGDSHDLRNEQDKVRDKYLESLGYKTLRFSNDDVLKILNDVVHTIRVEIRKQPPTCEN